MVKSKIYNAKSRTVKTPKGKKSKYDVKQNRMIQRIWSMTKPELKTYRSEVSGASADVNGYLYSFPALIVQGTTNATRIGSKIKIQSISIKYNVNGLNTTIGFARLMLVRNVNATLTIPDLPDFNNYTDLYKVFVYRDKLVPINTTSYKKVGAMTVSFPSGIQVDYDTDANDIMFYVVSDLAAIAGLTFDFNFIINYTDA